MSDKIRKLAIIMSENERDTLNEVKRGAIAAYRDWITTEIMRRGGSREDRHATFEAGMTLNHLWAQVPPAVGKEVRGAFQVMRHDDFQMINDFKSGIHPECTYREMSMIFLMQAGIPIRSGQNLEAYQYGQQLLPVIQSYRDPEYDIA